MKILVTGANGQLGYDVCKQLNARGIENKGVDIQDFDLTKAQQTNDFITVYRPEAIIHCAAYTAVDRAENDIETCFAVNAQGSANIADACKSIGAKLMYISTDYVFDGNGDQPFEADHPKSPQSVYGMSKSRGEDEVIKCLNDYFIVRISWVFGQNGNNFVKSMLRLGATQESINVVNDQVGTPTYTADLAPLLCNMIAGNQYGIYHATNEGFCSWYEFAEAIMQEAKLPCKIHPITTKDYPTAAIRPLNSRLSKKSLDDAGFARLPHWRDALQRYTKCLKEL